MNNKMMNDITISKYNLIMNDNINISCGFFEQWNVAAGRAVEDEERRLQSNQDLRPRQQSSRQVR